MPDPRPILTTECTLDIIKGRHPLTELVVPGPFIPNDTCMDQDSNRVHVITGESCIQQAFFPNIFLAVLAAAAAAAQNLSGLVHKKYLKGNEGGLGMQDGAFMNDRKCVDITFFSLLECIDDGLLAELVDSFATSLFKLSRTPSNFLCCTPISAYRRGFFKAHKMKKHVMLKMPNFMGTICTREKWFNTGAVYIASLLHYNPAENAPASKNACRAQCFWEELLLKTSGHYRLHGSLRVRSGFPATCYNAVRKILKRYRQKSTPCINYGVWATMIS
eukprot:1156824-Pelagomonas_calceolata.AAC.4